jgi:PAS domain-containing protein
VYPKPLTTKFLPAARSSLQDIEIAKQELLRKPILASLLDGIPVVILLLDTNRQIVLENRAAVALSGTGRIEDN